MYILTSNNSVLKFPYSLEELRSDNPQTSFPSVMSVDELSEWGVFTVEDESAPACNERNESIEITAPALVSGKWVRKWIVTTVSEEEIENRYLIEADQIRIGRNKLLKDSDHTQLNDYQGSSSNVEKMKRYRQALRDLPSQLGFPWDVIWPKPENEDS